MLKKRTWFLVEMTGSPREHGFKTKQKFIETLNSFGVDVQPSKLKHGADYLITNDLSSDTIKMKTAKQMRVPIKTYSEFVNEFKEIARAKKLQDILNKIKTNV